MVPRRFVRVPWEREATVTTPEGRVKDSIKKVLAKYNCYTYMPVQMGLGAAGLDFHCIVFSELHNVPLPFMIEAKAPGRVPSSRQEVLIGKLRKEYQCKVFVISGNVELKELEYWLLSLQRKVVE
jgi:hypothetical protein